MMPPFTIDPAQIAALDGKFALFIAHLLEAEMKAHDIAGHKLNFNKNETTPDGGVDAAVTNAVETSWLPAGSSAWQFKQAKPGATACATELAGAAWAHEYLKRGGHYIMVQGKMMTDQAIEERAEALRDKAVELGLIKNDAADRSRIRVYDANSLSRWASQYAALTLDPLLNIPLGPVLGFDRWSSSRPHQVKWVADEHRVQVTKQLAAALKKSNNYEFRIEGPSGFGKSRLVMETIRGSGLERLVAYAPDAKEVTTETISYLIGKERTAILIVDECDRHGHEKIVEQLSVNATMRIVTIGQADTRPLAVPTFVPGALPAKDIEIALKENRPTLWVEARRFVSEKCAGNIQLAYVLADRLIAKGSGQAAELMQRGDIEAILSIVFPEDSDFLLMTILALFDRIGWDGELQAELEIIATFCKTTASELRRVGARLEEQGLLERHGRYRSIVPNPVAVYLAARAWNIDGARVANQLLPTLTPSMMKAFFLRVADLGRYEPVSSVLEGLLDERGLFGTLQSIEDHGVGDFLIQLAIVAPERTVAHICKLVASASVEELRNRSGIRRSLVNALEKLAWHTATFRDSAQAMQRLALAENETYANNATGTWASLFGMVLPTTAASPGQRLEYLTSVAKSDDTEVRKLAIAACEAGLAFHESAIVSPELQEGATVEPRGSIKTVEEAVTYAKKLINLLTDFADDSDDTVSEAAFKALTGHLHPSNLDGYAGEQYRAAILALGKKFNKELRAEIATAKVWGTHTNSTEFIATLDSLLGQLPPLSDMEELESLGSVNSWEYNEEFLQQKLKETVSKIVESGGFNDIISWLSGEEVNSAWMVGDAIAHATSASEEARDALLKVAPTNLNAISGFLNASVQLGNESAFDNFIDSDVGQELDTKMRLFLTMRGPMAKTAMERAVVLAQRLQPKDAGRLLLVWGHELEPKLVVKLLNKWLTSTIDQVDYNTIIDWLSFWMHGRKEMPNEIKKQIWELLQKRFDFPAVGQENWDWSQLAKSFVATKATDIVALLLKLIAEKDQMTFSHQEESKLLTECIQRDPKGAWTIIVPYMEHKNWRIQTNIEGWLIYNFPIEIIRDWIGNSVEHGRLVAQLADPGDEQPSQLGKLLLNTFPDDTDIAHSLKTQYWKDSWSGSWSSHIQGQIGQLQTWVATEGEATPVGKWAKDMISNLQDMLKRVKQDEEEERR